MADRKFAVRFSVADMDKTKADLQQFGASGAAAIRGIDQASMKATPSLKALDHAAGEVRGQFDQFANQIPIVGGALKALGPAGTAAAAGIGALVLGLGAIATSARKAIDDISAIKDMADTLQLTAEQLQSLRGEGLLAGINNDALDKMLQTLAVNSARASEGFGKMKAALDKVDPVLGRQLAMTTTQAERIDILADAIQRATSANEKLNIATAAFGTQGAEMIRVLDQSGASMATFEERAKAAGLVISEDLVKKVEELGDRLAVLEAKRTVAQQRAAVAFADYLEGWERFQTDVTLLVPNLQEAAKSLQDQSTEYLLDMIDHWRQAAKERVVSEKWALEEIARFEGELKRRQDEDLAAKKAAAPPPRGAAGLEAEYLYKTRRPEEETPEEKAAREKAAAERAKAVAQAAEETAKRQAAANKLVAESQAEAAAEAKKWQDIIDGNRTATEKATSALDDLYLAFYLGKVTQEQYNALLPIFTKNLDDAKDAAEAATPAFQAIEEARRRISDAAKANMSEAQLVSVEQERLNKLIGSKGKDGVVFTAEEAAKALDAYKDSLHDAKDGMFELRAGAELLSEALDGQIKTIGDVGRVFVKVLKQMLVESLLAQQQLGKGGSGGGFGGWIGDIFSGIFNGASKTPPIAASVHHDGRQIGDASSFRLVNLNSYRGARRAHSGFAPDEYPIIAQTGERMLSRTDNATFTRAIERLAAGGGAGGVSIKIVDETGSRFETNERASADGGRELEIRVRKIARQESLAAMGSPDGTKVMRSVYGVSRKVS